MAEDFSQFEELKEKLRKAVQFFDEKKLEEVEELIKEFLKNFPSFLPARLEYADFLLEMGLPFEALNVLREGLRFSPDDLNLRYSLGVAKQKCWFLNSAEWEFQNLRKQKPNDPEILRQLGWTKVLKGELEEGRRLLREAIDLNLMNPYPYMDLGISYAMCFDFSEGFKWLETARNLKPDDPLIREEIEFTKKIEKDFNKFSEKDKKIIKEIRQNPEESKLLAIESMFLLSKSQPLTKDNYEEMKEEIKLAGFDPKMISIGLSKTGKQKTTIKYMKYHHKVSGLGRKISPKEFEEIKVKLLADQTEKKELKKMLLILAHQGTKEVIEFLKEYSREAKGELKDWAELALEECEIFSQTKPGQIVQIFHY